MASKDEENIAFINKICSLCLKMMHFDLKNIGAIYQHLVSKTFKQQMDHNMKVYIDDMLVKSTKADRHIKDLQKPLGNSTNIK